MDVQRIKTGNLSELHWFDLEASTALFNIHVFGGAMINFYRTEDGNLIREDISDSFESPEIEYVPSGLDEMLSETIDNKSDEGMKWFLENEPDFLNKFKH